MVCSSSLHVESSHKSFNSLMSAGTSILSRSSKHKSWGRIFHCACGTESASLSVAGESHGCDGIDPSLDK